MSLYNELRQTTAAVILLLALGPSSLAESALLSAQNSGWGAFCVVVSPYRQQSSSCRFVSIFFRIFVLIHCFLLLYTSWFLWAWFGGMRILFPAMSILILPNCAGDEWTWARRPSQMSGKTYQCFYIQSSYTIYKTGCFSPPTEWMCKMAG